MALQVRRASSYKLRLAASLIAVFALIAQPYVGIGLGNTAQAADVVTVDADNTKGWTKYGTGQTEYVRDNAAPLNQGALKISDTGDKYVMYYRDAQAPVPVENINISYDSRRVGGAVNAAPAFVLGIDTNNDMFDDIYAWYEPAYNGGVNYDNWQTWTLNQSAKFYFTDAAGNDVLINGKTQYAGTLQDVKAVHADAKVIDYTINQGTGNAGWITHVDNVIIPEAIYDFNPDLAAPTISNITYTPNVDSNTGGSSVTVSATIKDASGINLANSHVRFYRGPGVNGAAASSTNNTLVAVPGEADRYQATFNTLQFVEKGSEADYWIYFRLEDTKGNAVGNNDTRNVTVDNRAPAITNVRVASPASGSTEVRVKLTDSSGVNLASNKTHTRFYRGSGLTNGASAQSANTPFIYEASTDDYVATIDTTTFANEGSGSYWVYVRAEDGLGNAIGNNDTRGIKVDNTKAPVQEPDTDEDGGFGQGPGNSSTSGGSSNSGQIIITPGAISPFINTSTTPSSQASSVVSAFGITAPTESSNEEILGAETTKKQSDKVAAVEATDNGWNIFGLAWYWWILILAALAGLVWFLVRRRNTKQN